MRGSPAKLAGAALVPELPWSYDIMFLVVLTFMEVLYLHEARVSVVPSAVPPPAFRYGCII